MHKNRIRILVIAVIGIFVVILFSTIWIINLDNLPASGVKKAASTNSPTPKLQPTPSEMNIATGVEATIAPSVEPTIAVIGLPAPRDEETAEYAKTVDDVAYDYDAMVTAAVIRLDSDPEITGIDITTQVALRDETFTIFFKEPVDRNSVEAALTRNYSLNPELLLFWTSDRQLHVKVLVTKLIATDPNKDRYSLDLSGITSITGEALQKEDQGSIHFNAIIAQQLNQLWKFSIDGKNKEQLTHFTEPFEITTLDEENKQIMLLRSSHYCECDAIYPLYYSVLDIATSKRTAYPIAIQLSENYHGGGAFIADSRGFFFEQPAPSIEAPQSDSAHLIQLADFVFGASFSKNREELILAVGNKDQKDNYDLLILNLKSNKQQRYPHVIKGNTPEDQGYGRILPFVFKDDGQRVYFNATDWATHKDLNYYYEWTTKKLISWSPPEEVTGWTGFTESSNGTYRIYANGGLFKNGKHQKTSFMMENYYGGIWIPETDLYVVPERTGDSKSIVSLDPATLTLTPLISNLPSDPELYSISADGKWLTLSMRG